MPIAELKGAGQGGGDDDIKTQADEHGGEGLAQRGICEEFGQQEADDKAFERKYQQQSDKKQQRRYDADMAIQSLHIVQCIVFQDIGINFVLILGVVISRHTLFTVACYQANWDTAVNQMKFKP